VAVGVLKFLRSIPTFWGGLFLLLFFSVYLRWFPLAGMQDPRIIGSSGIVYVFDVLRHLFLPCLTMLIFWQLPYLSHLTRSTIIEIMNEDFIVTARSKGLKENVVFSKHALRNALLPVITMTGLGIGFAVAGTVWTETVFSWPGIGLLLYKSMLRRDYPIVMGIWIIVAVIVIFMNLIVDILYTYVDPRIEY
jgi:peptide/nickel transport system permease protein